MKTTYEDDGLLIESVGLWTRQKHSLIAQYAAMFAKSMKYKWECKVYIDLFASSGFARVKKTSRIVAASPLLALNIDDDFDKYIFCEYDKDKCTALTKRVKRYHSDKNTSFLCGDSNNSVENIISLIPRPSRKYRVLSFCVVDPYKVDNFSFSTIEGLSKLFMDFLVLIPSYMDANRNTAKYFEEADNRIEKFIGNPKWRKEWVKSQSGGIRFGDFLVLQFNQSMKNLGFLELKSNEYVLIRNPKNKSPLYHLAFYSKHPLGKKFWNEARIGSNQQLNLFE